MSVIVDRCSQIVEMHQAEEIDGFLVDVQTARVLVRVYEALSPTSRAKFDSVPLDKLATFAWSKVSA